MTGCLLCGRSVSPATPRPLRGLRGLALAASWLAIGASTVAAQDAGPTPSSQLGQLHCSATSSSPVVRLEGTSELVGDVVITCHNAGPPERVEPRGSIEADIALSLSVGVGNRTGFGLGTDVSDAVVVVNEKNCVAPGTTGTFTSCGSENHAVQDPMLARLEFPGSATLGWSRVAIPVPGAPAGAEGPVASCAGPVGNPGGCHAETTTIRLTNIRANASQLGAGSRATGVAIPIQASLSLRAPGSRIHLDGSQLRVAEAATGLLVRALPVDSDRLCSHGETIASVALSEGFASSFKAPGRVSLRPGQPGWEEAFYPVARNDPGPSYASEGTRLQVALSGIPSPISVSVPAAIECASEGGGGSRLEFVDGATSFGEGGTVATGQVGDRSLRVTAESEARALYEVVSSDPLAREACTVPFRLSRPAAASGLFGGWTVGAVARLAPFGTEGPLNANDGGARFAKVGFEAADGFRMAGCGTTLFFPFVTSRSNFDTAIVIANTSADPLGTRHQSGQCILHYRGSVSEPQGEPSIQRSGRIEAGQQLAFTLSSGRLAHGLVPVTDFQGSLVAECGFQHGQGFAFVTEQISGTAILAQGYLAEVVASTVERETDGDDP